ncbi:D-fructose-6-phosphate amidotransferase [Pelomyxa schiedti]|nr:D-fructose-6-phosphate amidotransferase [Pelomyxa schiedti]
MPAYVIVESEVHNAAQFMKYVQASPATLANFGGRFIVRGGPVTPIEGTWDPKRLTVIEFPTMAAAQGWYNSPQYVEARKLREGAATFKLVMVEGV